MTLLFAGRRAALRAGAADIASAIAAAGPAERAGLEHGHDARAAQWAPKRDAHADEQGAGGKQCEQPPVAGPAIDDLRPRAHGTLPTAAREMTATSSAAVSSS